MLAFAQLTWRESLCDIETCLFGSPRPKAPSRRIRQPTARNTLAVTNEKRDWRIFADFAQVLIQQATALYDQSPVAAFAWARQRRESPSTLAASELLRAGTARAPGMARRRASGSQISATPASIP